MVMSRKSGTVFFLNSLNNNHEIILYKDMIRRLCVEKKPEFAIVAKELKGEMSAYLGIAADGVRTLVRYDVENISDETFEKAKITVFSEPPVDDVYEETFPHGEDDFVFTVEYLPGQFDQRADSAEQCVCLLNPAEHPIIRSATTYVVSGALTPEQREAVVKHCVNPVDSRVAADDKPDTLAVRIWLKWNSMGCMPHWDWR